MEIIKDFDKENVRCEGVLTCSVYVLHFPDGKVYVGMTSRDTEDRWRGGKGYYLNKKLSSEIFRVGWENIKTEVLCSGLDWKDALRLEGEMIEKYNATDPACGYNNCPSGVKEPVIDVSSTVVLSRSDCGGTHKKWKHGGARIGMYNFNGELEVIFDDIDDAVKNNAIGATYAGIVGCITGKLKKHAGKIWRKEAAV